MSGRGCCVELGVQKGYPGKVAFEYRPGGKQEAVEVEEAVRAKAQQSLGCLQSGRGHRLERRTPADQARNWGYTRCRGGSQHEDLASPE